MSNHGSFQPLEIISQDGSVVQSPIDLTMSLSPSPSTSTAELVSTSAPVNIPIPQNKVEHLSIHQMDEMSMSVMPVSDEFDHNTIFGSFAMTQSLRSNPDATLEDPRTFHRAISTNARMEHFRSQKESGDEEGMDTNVSPTTMVEDPFFPFLNPDLGGDMTCSATEMSTEGISDSLMSDVNRVAIQTAPAKKKRWMITKGLSEADIGPNHHHHHRNVHHGGRIMTSTASTNEVQPTHRSTNREGARPSVTRHLSRQNSRGMRRKSSITSNLSFLGNYVFGSSVFQSPARSNASMEKVNIVTDSVGIYPSMLSLASAEVGIMPLDEELFVPLSTSQPRSASSSRQNSRQDLQQEAKKGHARSVSVTSRGSSISLFTKQSGKEADDRISLRDEDEAADKLTDVKPVVSRIVPPKKQWQQTMPDLVEGPESDTLTVQSTIRKSLAAAALAMGRVDQKKASMDPKSEEEKDDSDEQATSQREMTPRMYLKNLYVVCIVYFFSFAAYLSLRNLQSSLNDKDGLGMYSLSCIYAFLCLGSLLTTTIIQRLRPKLSMLIGLIGLLVYNLCNFYPTHATLIPGSCIAGFSLAILWTSQATYMANNAASYAAATGKRFQDCISHFHGTFFASFQFSQMVGGAISSLIFSLQSPKNISNDIQSQDLMENSQIINHKTDGFVNSSHLDTALKSVRNTTTWLYEQSDDFVYDYTYSLQLADNSSNGTTGMLMLNTWTNVSTEFCGINNCPSMAKSQLNIQIDRYYYYIMVVAFVCSTLLSITILLVCLDPLEGSMKNPRAGIGNQLLSVFRMLSSPHIICLLPFMGYTLLQATFVFGEFNKAFVTCYMGIHMIGLMTVCLSIFSCFFSFFTGTIQKYIGPEVIIVAGLLAHLSVLTSLWFWKPSADKPYMFFIAMAIWGAGDGIITTLIVSLLGVLFIDKKEAVFSTHKMTQAASAFTLFITGPYLCTSTKVIALMVIATMAIIGYVILKVRLRVACRMSLQLPIVVEMNIDVPNKR